MATKTASTFDATGSTTHERPTGDSGIAATARQVADSMAGAAGEVTARIPDVAQGTRTAMGEANRLVSRGSDESLRLAGAGAVGFALGLFIGGAARILVLLALVPALVVGATLLDRSGGRARLAD